MWTLRIADILPVALEGDCSDEYSIRSRLFLNLFEKSQSTGNKPVTWNDFLMSRVLSQWNPKTPHISLNWTDFVFTMAILITLSLVSLTAPRNAFFTNWSHGSRNVKYSISQWFFPTTRASCGRRESISRMCCSVKSCAHIYPGALQRRGLSILSWTLFQTFLPHPQQGISLARWECDPHMILWEEYLTVAT